MEVVKKMKGTFIAVIICTILLALFMGFGVSMLHDRGPFDRNFNTDTVTFYRTAGSFMFLAGIMFGVIIGIIYDKIVTKITKE